jgi:hypothetical protein
MPPLQMKLRLEMEHRFGVSFDGVHVIESWLPLSFGALACVHGQRIYVVPGLGNLDCFAAKEILAHELAHVVQQRYGMTSEYSGLCEDVELEAEAEELGRLAAGGKRVRVRTRGNSAIAGGQPVWQCIKTTFAGISSPKLLQILDRSVNALIQSISLNIYEDKDKKNIPHAGGKVLARSTRKIGRQ